jgi:N-acetyl-anhydromuramyl-L-alanine amidase AmpD
MINFGIIKNLFSVFTKSKTVLDLQQEFNLKNTGKVDDETYRVSELKKEAKSLSSYILCDGEQIHIDANVVQLPLPTKCYSKTKNTRSPTMIVVHWDAALSSKSCYDILAKRGISTHFSIDNDGTIYQFVDSNDITWHSGPTKQDREVLAKKNVQIPPKVSWNNISIGIDISNAYYLKYNDAYVKRGFGPRPVIKSKCHGMNLEHLGYYPAQVESFKKLIRVLCDIYNIDLAYPTQSGKTELSTTISVDAIEGKFNGIVNHYNLTTNKIDTSGFPIEKVVNELKGE